MTMKASTRRVILRRMQALVNTLIDINEQAAATAALLIAAGVTDVGDTVNKILAAGGEYDTTDTVATELIEIIDGTNGSLDWAYLAE